MSNALKESYPTHRQTLAAGELYNKDLAEIPPALMPTWIAQNPLEAGRIVGYHEAHHDSAGQTQQSEAFTTFMSTASRILDNNTLLGAVYRFGIEQGQALSTPEIKLEKTVRAITRAHRHMASQNHSSEAKIVR